MMNKFKCLLLLLGLILPATFGLANSRLITEKDGGDAIIVIKTNDTTGIDRSIYISVFIDNHTLTVSFLTNIGQVTVKVLDENNITLDLLTTPTPTGYLYYIPNAGRYTVVFTLSDGDEYYGEFEVTD